MIIKTQKYKNTKTQKYKNSKKHKKNNTLKYTKNKYFKKSVITKSFFNKTKYWGQQEHKYAYSQGKGYGGSSIVKEVELCIKFMHTKPLIFIDVGAEKGNYTKEVLKYFPNIKVFIFEPSKIHHTKLNTNFGKLPNVHISDLALSNNTGKQKLYFDEEGSAFSSLFKRRLDHFNIYMNYSEEIETIRFDEFWKQQNIKGIIDYVKLDVEGYELNVLAGMGDLLKIIGLIQFEFGGTNIDSRTYFQDFWYLFKDYNFSIYRITPTLLLPINKYSESHEFFKTTNYIAVNNNINKYNTNKYK